MDVSGSMNQSKKFIARSFFFLLYHFIRYRYEKVEIVFISHTSTAKEVSEEDFFSRASSGGTYISSGTSKCLEIIEKRKSNYVSVGFSIWLIVDCYSWGGFLG